jgi:hypothetical protein
MACMGAGGWLPFQTEGPPYAGGVPWRGLRPPTPVANRRTHYNWKKADPDYREAFLQATIEAGDALEDKLMDLAHEGNVTAAIFLLKGMKPEKFKDRNETTFQWDGDPNKLSEPQLEKVIEWLEAMAPQQIKQPQRPALPPGDVIDVEAIPPDEPSGSISEGSAADSGGAK